MDAAGESLLYYGIRRNVHLVVWQFQILQWVVVFKPTAIIMLSEWLKFKEIPHEEV
jgi:hypothetical protein